MKTFYSEMKSPIGKLKLVADDSKLLAIMFENSKGHTTRFADATRAADHPILRAAEKELAEYFAGQRTNFSVPLGTEGTDFQQRVWAKMRKIPFGSSCSYGELARAIGRPTAARAVGAASGRNPLGIMVPCHRVIGTSGELTGFGGGLDVKAQLLALEQRVAAKSRS
jgi:methylated-DNA-[protein]-cysteine S-methyltransferase